MRIQSKRNSKKFLNESGRTSKVKIKITLFRIGLKLPEKRRFFEPENAGERKKPKFEKMSGEKVISFKEAYEA